jgi:hypothetical protein
MIVTGDEGAGEILAAYFQTRNLTLKLFTNDYTPQDTDTVDSYTEATGGGYAAISLLLGGWTLTTSSIAQVAYSQVEFVFTGALTTNFDVYGYYVINPATGKFVFAERKTKFTPEANGEAIIITPTYQLSQGTPT